jgi:hypothetical protein
VAHSLAPALPILIGSLTIPIAIWTTLYGVWNAQRVNGRRAVEAELTRLGERAVSIENVPLGELTDRAGLTGVWVFRVAGRRKADGSATTHLWAYEPGLAARFGGPGGLKRLAHGVWIPVT